MCVLQYLCQNIFYGNGLQLFDQLTSIEGWGYDRIDVEHIGKTLNVLNLIKL